MADHSVNRRSDRSSKDSHLGLCEEPSFQVPTMAAWRERLLQIRKAVDRGASLTRQLPLNLNDVSRPRSTEPESHIECPRAAGRLI